MQIFREAKKEFIKEYYYKLEEFNQFDKKAGQDLKNMQQALFTPNDEPLEKIRKQKVHAFKFLWDVAYDIEALPGDIMHSDRRVMLIRYQLENPEEAQLKFTPEGTKFLNDIENFKKYFKKYYDPKDMTKKLDYELIKDKHDRTKKVYFKEKYQKCNQLKELVKTVLFPAVSYEDEARDDPIHNEMRGRLGANILMSIMNTKSVTKDLVIGLVCSLIGTVGLAALIDIGLLHLLLFLTGLFPPLAVLNIPLAIIIPSLTPRVAETFYSFIVKRMLGTARGKPLWPKTKKELISNLKEALLAGSIAAVGSVPFNALIALAKVATGGWAWLPLKAVANFVRFNFF